MNSEYVLKPIQQIDTYLIQLVHINDYVLGNQVVVLIVALHTILLLFIITLVRVVTTLPGRVPREWLDKVEREIHQIIENEENIINKKGSQTSTSFSSEVDEEQRLQLNVKAKMELIDKSGRRFCKNCSTFKPKRCHHCR